MKKPQTKVVEIHVHRSRKNPKLGHAVAILFPCSHNKYLGLTLFKGKDDEDIYRTQSCRVIRFEDYDVMDKEYCKLCPYESEIEWFESSSNNVSVDSFIDVLESIDDL